MVLKSLLLPLLGLCCAVGWTTLAQEVEAEEVMLLLHGTCGEGITDRVHIRGSCAGMCTGLPMDGTGVCWTTFDSARFYHPDPDVLPVQSFSANTTPSRTRWATSTKVRKRPACAPGYIAAPIALLCPASYPQAVQLTYTLLKISIAPDLTPECCFTLLTRIICHCLCSSVETIGDCYMAACGLLSEEPCHAASLVAFGKAIIAAAATVRNPRTGNGVEVGKV